MEATDFADQLRRYRRRCSLTQEELAERAGLSPAVISRLERGLTRAPQKFTVQTLTVALELSPEETLAFAAAARRAARAGGQPVQEVVDPAPDVPTGVAIPIPLTALIGRERDVEALVGLLADPAVRLLTLTGPAGVGKTRLATHVAALLRERQRREVVVVELIPVLEPQRVLPTVAQALGVRESGTLPLHESLIAALRERRLTLVLDNFEQVLPAARSVLEVLVACPGVQALVTSRAALNVRGERCYPVAPLALPDPAQLRSLDALCRVPTVALFVERVAAVQPGFALATLGDGRLVAEICQRLDGLPLAIELAAARVRTLGLEQLHERLAQPALLGVLGAGPHDLADHQRTMRSTIAWSYHLLAEPERRLFRWLGVFVSGASLEAIVAVTLLSEEAVLTGLSTLLDASLVECVESAHSRRYSQLVTVHAYAREQLTVEGEWDEARSRHASYFLEVVEGLRDEPAHRHDRLWLQVEADHENVRAALGWAWETNATYHGLLMVGALWRFWFSHSPFLEGLEWLERFIARAGKPTCSEEQRALAEAWTGVLVLNHRLDRFEQACAAGEMALALRRDVGDARQIAAAMMNLGNPLTQLGDFERAAALYQESLALYRELGDRQGMVFPLMNLGGLYYEMGEPRRALEYNEASLALSYELEENDWARGLTWNNIGEAYIALDEPVRAVEVTQHSLQVFMREHDVFGTVTTSFTLGRAYWRLGDVVRARAFLEEAERLYRSLGNHVMAARVLYVHASLALDHGDIPKARQALAQALASLAGQSRTSPYLWWLAERTATLALASGDPNVAGHLYGAALAHREARLGPFEPAEREMRARDLDRLRAALGEPALDAALAVGRGLAPEAAIAQMRSVLAATHRDGA